MTDYGINLLSELIAPLSVVLAMVLLVHRPLLNRFGPQCVYWLWLLVPLSMACYLLPVASFSQQIAAGGQVERFIVSSAATIKSGFDGKWFGMIWLLGSASLLAVWLFNHMVLVKKLKLTPYKLQDNLVDMPQKLSIYQSAHTFSPLLLGLYKQKLVVPEDFTALYTTEQQKLILEHEICHFDRNDIYWNLLAFSFIALFWFHPLVWLAYFRFRRDQELSCDHSVLARKQLKSRINYSKALLVSAESSPPITFAHLTFKQYGDKEIMFERIKHIQSNVKTSKLGLFALMALAVTGVTSMSYAGSVGAETGAKASSTYEQSAYQAKPIKRIEPRYPAAAAAEQASGSVLLKFDVDQQGNAINIEVVKSKPEGLFDDSAVDALAQWKYEQHQYGVIADNYVQLDFMFDDKADKTHLIESIRVSN